jgi:hypothetical protein
MRRKSLSFRQMRGAVYNESPAPSLREAAEWLFVSLSRLHHRADGSGDRRFPLAPAQLADRRACGGARSGALYRPGPADAHRICIPCRMTRRGSSAQSWNWSHVEPLPRRQKGRNCFKPDSTAGRSPDPGRQAQPGCTSCAWSWAKAHLDHKPATRDPCDNAAGVLDKPTVISKTSPNRREL